jgi:predicted DNA-binding transcriptional regulator AlpA|tara:strand:- start:219 stop:455 length:237 start_codon:yes stop_codon:yes gene_type:complete
MDKQFFLDQIGQKPFYRMCDLHRPNGVLPLSRAKLYKDMRAGTFPKGIDLDGAGHVWTREMLAENLLQRYEAKRNKAA